MDKVQTPSNFELSHRQNTLDPIGMILLVVGYK
jgi:hypothetical protein